jgi:hypothetical protein
MGEENKERGSQRNKAYGRLEKDFLEIIKQFNGLDLLIE